MLGVVNVVGSDVVDTEVVGNGVEGTDVEGNGVEGNDVTGADVEGTDVEGNDVEGGTPPEQRSTPFSLIEVNSGSWSPEKLSWKPNSAKSFSFPEK